MSTEQKYDPAGSGANIGATPQAFTLLEPAPIVLDLYPLSLPGKTSDSLLVYRALSAYKADLLNQLLLTHKTGAVSYVGRPSAYELFGRLNQLEKLTSELAEQMDSFGEAGQMAYQAFRDQEGYDKWETEQERILEEDIDKYIATYFNAPAE